jgi:hypothetical protein
LTVLFTQEILPFCLQLVDKKVLENNIFSLEKCLNFASLNRDIFLSKLQKTHPLFYSFEEKNVSLA